jgi:glycosyltransferase involved in cell wall biosynthesis
MVEMAAPAAPGVVFSSSVQDAGGKREDAPSQLRLGLVGMSVSPTCGVRAHTGLLTDGLAAQGVACSTHWLERDERCSLRAARADVRAWARRLPGQLREQRAEAVLLQYSIFAYSHRGLPLFVEPTLAALRGTRLPLLAFMHELAFPWSLRGWRGRAWALSQRVALVDALRSCAGAVVTTDQRADWLLTRRWLPRRPVRMAPVFSNLPPPRPSPHRERERPRLGLFGYASYHPRSIALVLDAVAGLRDLGTEVELALLGAPGSGSPVAEAWLEGAAARGLQGALRFDGPLATQLLSDELAACDALVFADRPGPSSRKGTLAGSLASGRPVIATDGPQAWDELARSDALCLVPARADALADALARLLGEPDRLDDLGARGRAFAEQRMGVAYSAEVVAGLLREHLSA